MRREFWIDEDGMAHHFNGRYADREGYDPSEHHRAAVILPGDVVLSADEAAFIRENLALMAEGEGPNAGVYITMAGDALKRLDRAMKGDL